MEGVYYLYNTRQRGVRSKDLMPFFVEYYMIISKLLNYCIAVVWLANGLFCKVLNLVPRHQQIVSRILGEQYSVVFTKAIGIAETAMAIWIVSGIWPRLNAITQIAVIAIMNLLEFILVPDLLLWGRLNLLFAGMFILIIWYNSFYLRLKPVH
jgi:DoxX-like protein